MHSLMILYLYSKKIIADSLLIFEAAANAVIYKRICIKRNYTMIKTEILDFCNEQRKEFMIPQEKNISHIGCSKKRN